MVCVTDVQWSDGKTFHGDCALGHFHIEVVCDRCCEWGCAARLEYRPRKPLHIVTHVAFGLQEDRVILDDPQPKLAAGPRELADWSARSIAGSLTA